MRKRFILLLLDVAIILLATMLAVLLRDNFETRFTQFQGLIPYFAATALTSLIVLSLFGLDRAIWRMSSMLDYLIVSGAAVSIVMLTVGESFLFNRLEGVARAMPILQVLLMICGLVGVRVLARLRHSFRSRARVQPAAAMMEGNTIPYESILIVGLGRIAELYVQSVEEYGAGTKRIVGLLGIAGRHSGRRIHQHAILGPTDQIESILQDLEVHGVFVDRIVVTLPFGNLPPEARQCLLDLTASSTIKLELFAQQFEAAHNSGSAELGNDTTEPALPSNDTASKPKATPPNILPRKTTYWQVKRAFDVACSSVMIVALLPVFLVVAVLAAIDVGLPLWFWQQRPGVGKKPFRVYKFRTMRGAYDWNGNRIDDKNRSSVIGRLLRRTRLDELPQLLNILIGQMSFVGPRPLLAIDQCESNESRLMIRPGLTGWAQVNGGRLLTIPEKMALDLWYLQNASFGVDVRIVIETVRMILFGETRNEDAISRATSSLKATTFRSPSVTSRPFDDTKRQVA
ncbi:MAG: sugar transferase [Hyphomicrobiaceae bacterium]